MFPLYIIPRPLSPLITTNCAVLGVAVLNIDDKLRSVNPSCMPLARDLIPVGHGSVRGVRTQK